MEILSYKQLWLESFVNAKTRGHGYGHGHRCGCGCEYGHGCGYGYGYGYGLVTRPFQKSGDTDKVWTHQ